MLSRFKPFAEKSLRPVIFLLKDVNPNVITLLGLIFPVLFFVFVILKWYILALFVFIFNGVDMLDGLVARLHKKVTPFGGFLDSTVDRFSDFVVIMSFGFGGLVNWTIVMPFLLFTFLISYIRSRIELAVGGTLTANVGIMERTERLVGIFVGLIFYIIFPEVNLFGFNVVSLVFLVLLILSAVTVAQRIIFAYKNL